MKTKIGFVVLVLLIGVFMGGNAYAQLVCYGLDYPEGGGERFKLQINEQGPLSTPKESAIYHHPIQTVYSVHGKYVFWGPLGPYLMAPVAGTIIKGTPPRGGDAVTGAHMGLRVTLVRDIFPSLQYECTTEETTQTPDTWSCFHRREQSLTDPLHVDPTKLTKIVGMDKFCSIFEEPFVFPTE